MGSCAAHWSIRKGLNMQSVRFSLAAIAFGIALFVCGGRQVQANPTTGSCPRVTATRYVAGGGLLSGSHYIVMVANEDCAQVASWVKKIVAQHVPGAADEDTNVKGPGGYTCTASPDDKGHPYQGKCEKNGDANTGFSWVMGG